MRDMGGRGGPPRGRGGPPRGRGGPPGRGGARGRGGPPRGGRGGARGGRGGIGAGFKVLVEPHPRFKGVYCLRGKDDALCTKNLTPGESVYNEKRVSMEVSKREPHLFKTLPSIPFIQDTRVNWSSGLVVRAQIGGQCSPLLSPEIFMAFNTFSWLKIHHVLMECFLITGQGHGHQDRVQSVEPLQIQNRRRHSRRYRQHLHATR